MRKVLPKDELVIPTVNVAEKIKKFNDKPASPSVIKAYYKLEKRLENATNIDPVIIMKIIYRFVDKMMETDVYPDSVCTKGCAHCCSIPVGVTKLEALFIDHMTRKDPKATFIKDLTGVHFPKSKADSYCPFLDQETATCTIYEVRPFNCRTFASMDHWQECEDDRNAHAIYSWQSSEITKHLNKWLISIHRNNSKTGNTDIRDWFKPLPEKKARK